MGIITIFLIIAFLIFSFVFLIPILLNLENVAEFGLICGVLGICIGDTEDSEKFQEEQEKKEQEADERLPNPSGETICDLSVFVDAELVDKDFTIKIKMNEADPANYEWHCQFPNPLNWLGSLELDPMAFFLESEFIHTEIVLIDEDNRSFKYDANHPDYKSMFREKRITDTTGIVPLPLNFDQTFYVRNIVHDDYILEIYQGRQINNLPVGDPIKDMVCEVGKNPDTKNLRCN